MQTEPGALRIPVALEDPQNGCCGCIDQEDSAQVVPDSGQRSPSPQGQHDLHTGPISNTLVLPPPSLSQNNVLVVSSRSNTSACRAERSTTQDQHDFQTDMYIGSMHLGAGVRDVIQRASSLKERQSVAGSAAWHTSPLPLPVGVIGDPAASELSDSPRPLSHFRNPARTDTLISEIPTSVIRQQNKGMILQLPRCNESHSHSNCLCCPYYLLGSHPLYQQGQPLQGLPCQSLHCWPCQ